MNPIHPNPRSLTALAENMRRIYDGALADEKTITCRNGIYSVKTQTTGAASAGMVEINLHYKGTDSPIEWTVDEGDWRYTDIIAWCSAGATMENADLVAESYAGPRSPTVVADFQSAGLVVTTAVAALTITVDADTGNLLASLVNTTAPASAESSFHVRIQNVGSYDTTLFQELGNGA